MSTQRFNGYLVTHKEEDEPDGPLADFLADEDDSLSNLWDTGLVDDGMLTNPLCVIGLGGTGRKAVVEMKAGYIEKLGRLPPNVRLLAFDSADDPVSAIESRNGRVVRLEIGSEFHPLPRVPVEGIRRNLSHHPEIADRFGPVLHQIRRTSIHNGAAQQRPQGLLALAWAMPKVRQVIETALRQLTGRSDDLAAQMERKQGVTVLVIASAPGGQGSGSILDCAYVVRDILRQLGDQSDVSRVLGLLVLPAAFVGVNGGNLHANTGAILAEIQHLMGQAYFRARYPGGDIESHQPPFDELYILDGIDELGRAWPNHDEVCANGARAMLHLLASPVGQEEAAKMVNHREAAQMTASGSSGYLSTIGLAVIRFPARLVAQRCALRQADALIHSHLLASGKEDPSLISAPPDLETLTEHLLRDTGDAPFRVELGEPTGLWQAAPEEIPSQARTLLAHYLERRLYGEIFEKMAAKRTVLEESLVTALAEQLGILLRYNRVPLLARWLEEAQGVLQKSFVTLTATRKRIGEEVVDQEKMVAQTQALLDEAAQSFPPVTFLRRRLVRPALTAFLEEANRQFVLLLEQRAVDLALEINRRLLLWVDGQQRAVDAAVERLHQASQRLTARSETLSRLDGSYNEISVADEALVEELYREHSSRPDLLVQQVVEQNAPLLTWGSQRPQQLAAWLVSAASVPFQAIRAVTVEEILARRWDDRSAQQWLERLTHLAAGAWNLDSALLPAGGAALGHSLILGVPDARRSIFAAAGRSLISNHDPERIVALRTVHGAPMESLKAMPLWKAAYSAALGRVPLHILPEFMRQDDTAVQSFALAIIFDHVTTRGPWFYFRTSDPLDPELKLGQGLEKALAGFAEEPELRQQVDERVAEEIRKRGIAWALERLDGYITAGSPKDDSLNQKLRRAARSYADELRRSSQATASVEREIRSERAAG